MIRPMTGLNDCGMETTFQIQRVGRNQTISFARLIAMIFIIVCHFFQYYSNELAYWFNVGVQIFLCISGFLYGGKDIDDPMQFYCRTFKKILIPYYSFLLPIIVVYFVFQRNYISVSSVINAFLCSGTIKGLGHLWFISYILLCYLITPLLQEIFKKMVNTKGVYAVLSLVFIMVVVQILSIAYDSYFMYSRISCYIAGYFMAFMLKKHGEKIFKNISYLCVFAGMAFNVVKIYFKYFTTLKIPGFQYIDQYSHVLLGISIFLLIFIYCRGIKESKVLKLSDKYSYYVYIVHQLLILSPFSLMAVTHNILLNWIIVCIGITVFALLLYLVSAKVMFFWDRTEKAIYKKMNLF